MATITLSAYDDTESFEQALQEYREAVRDYSNFLDLHVETQQHEDDALRPVALRVLPSAVKDTHAQTEIWKLHLARSSVMNSVPR